MIPADTLQATHPAAAPEKKLVALAAPESPSAEQYRVLYQRLARLAARRAMRVVAVTSASRGEGAPPPRRTWRSSPRRRGAPSCSSMATSAGRRWRAYSGSRRAPESRRCSTAPPSCPRRWCGSARCRCSARETCAIRPQRSGTRARWRSWSSCARRTTSSSSTRARARLRGRRAARGRSGRGRARGPRRGDAQAGRAARARVSRRSRRGHGAERRGPRVGGARSMVVRRRRRGRAPGSGPARRLRAASVLVRSAVEEDEGRGGHDARRGREAGGS